MIIDKKPKAKTQTSTLQIRIPLDIRQEFNELCSIQGINSSELLRNMIIQWIKDNRPQ